MSGRIRIDTVPASQIWRDALRPRSRAFGREFRFASHRYASIELNGAFHSLRTPSSFLRWLAHTPGSFTLAINHSLVATRVRLQRRFAPIETRLAVPKALLAQPIGSLLWPFPDCLSLSPRASIGTNPAWQACASTWPGSAPNARSWPSLEICNQAFRIEDLAILLRKQGIALVVGDASGRWLYVEDAAAQAMCLSLQIGAELSASDNQALHGTERPAPREAHTPACKYPLLPRRTWAVWCRFSPDTGERFPIDPLRLLALRDADSGAWPLPPTA